MNVGACRRDLDVEAFGDHGLHLFGVGDQTDRTHVVGKVIKRLKSRVQGILVESSEALVDEDRVQLDATTVALDNV